MNKSETIHKILSIIYNLEKKNKSNYIYIDENTKLSCTYDLINYYYHIYNKNNYDIVNDNTIFTNLCNDILEEYHYQISNKNDLGLPLLFYWPQYREH